MEHYSLKERALTSAQNFILFYTAPIFTWIILSILFLSKAKYELSGNPEGLAETTYYNQILFNFSVTPLIITSAITLIRGLKIFSDTGSAICLTIDINKKAAYTRRTLRHFIASTPLIIAALFIYIWIGIVLSKGGSLDESEMKYFSPSLLTSIVMGLIIAIANTVALISHKKSLVDKFSGTEIYVNSKKSMLNVAIRNFAFFAVSVISIWIVNSQITSNTFSHVDPYKIMPFLSVPLDIFLTTLIALSIVTYKSGKLSTIRIIATLISAAVIIISFPLTRIAEMLTGEILIPWGSLYYWIESQMQNAAAPVAYVTFWLLSAFLVSLIVGKIDKDGNHATNARAGFRYAVAETPGTSLFMTTMAFGFAGYGAFVGIDYAYYFFDAENKIGWLSRSAQVIAVFIACYIVYKRGVLIFLWAVNWIWYSVILVALALLLRWILFGS